MKKLLLSLFILSSSLLTLKAQSKWSPRASLPDSTRGYGVGFSIGNYGYAGLGGKHEGSKWEYFTDFWQFNPSTDSWTRKADFPGKARICPTAFVIGNYAYVVCGSQNNEGYDLQTECWQYNSVTDKWKQKHDFPGLSRYSAVGFAIGKNGYMGTGYDTLPSLTPVLRDFWEYDTATDTWTQKRNFGGIPRYCASGFSVGGKGYICFGLDSAQVPIYISTANDMWEYDTTTDFWTQKSSNPKDSMGFASGFVIGSNIYVGPGQEADTKLIPDFWQYNTITDAWTQQANFPGGPAGECSAFTIGDTGYMGLGVNGDTSLDGSNKFFRFKPDSTTGINKIQNYETQISIYPNPFSQNCTISITGDDGYYIQSLKVYDIEGKQIEVNITKTGNNYVINRGNFQAGIYILSIELNDQIITKKLIITN